MFTCPVCLYDRLAEPPEDYNICDCCGTEFGYDTQGKSNAELRAAWIAAGYPWFSPVLDPPIRWNPERQVQKLVILH